MKNKSSFPFLLIILLFFLVIGFKIISNRNLIFSTGFDSEKIEQNLKSNFPFLEHFRNLRGLFMSATNKSIIGDNEFFKDNNGIVRIVAKKQDKKNENFIPSMKSLSEIAEQKKIPLLYINFPDAASGNQYPFKVAGQQDNSLLNKIKDYGFTTISPKLNSKKEQKDFFLTTDFHFSTKAEFEVGKEIANKLKKQLNLKESEIQRIFNLKNYDVESVKFWGNTIRSIGEYFVPPDSFDFYLPKFPTYLTEIVPSLGICKTGDFKEVCLNNFEASIKNYSPYNYWVTNYGNYPQEYYEIKNDLNKDGPVVLFICDSTLMRTFSYFSLLVGKTIVFDPRVDPNSNTLNIILNSQKINAIIVGGYSEDFFNSQFKIVDKIKLTNVPQDTKSLITGHNGKNIGWISFQTKLDSDGIYFLKDDCGIIGSQLNSNSKTYKTDFVGNNPEFFYSPNNKDYLIKILPIDSTNLHEKKNNISMSITTINGSSVSEGTIPSSIKIPHKNLLSQNKIVGWAAELNNGEPVESITIKDGSKIKKCSVRLLRPDISNFFKTKFFNFQFTKRSGFECDISDTPLINGLIEFQVQPITGKMKNFQFTVESP